MAVTYTPIQTYVVPSNTASIALTSISSSYTDLILAVGGKASGDTSMNLQFNSETTGTNYSATYIYGTGSAATSQRQSNNNKMPTMGRLSSDGGTSVIHLQGYSGSTNKTVIGRGSSTGLVIASVGLWRNSAAISRIDVTLEGSATITAGTVFTLYGILVA